MNQMMPDGGGGGPTGGPNEQRLYRAAFDASEYEIDTAATQVHTTTTNLDFVSRQLDRLVPKLNDAWTSADGQAAVASTKALSKTLQAKSRELVVTQEALRDAHSVVTAARQYWSQRQPPPTAPTKPTFSDGMDPAQVLQAQSRYNTEQASHDSAMSTREAEMDKQYTKLQQGLRRASEDMARANSLQVWDNPTSGTGGSGPGPSGGAPVGGAPGAPGVSGRPGVVGGPRSPGVSHASPVLTSPHPTPVSSTPIDPVGPGLAAGPAVVTSPVGNGPSVDGSVMDGLTTGSPITGAPGGVFGPGGSSGGAGSGGSWGGVVAGGAVSGLGVAAGTLGMTSGRAGSGIAGARVGAGGRAIPGVMGGTAAASRAGGAVGGGAGGRTGGMVVNSGGAAGGRGGAAGGRRADGVMIPGQSGAAGKAAVGRGAAGKAARAGGRGAGGVGSSGGKDKGRAQKEDLSLVTEDQWIDEGESTDGVVR